MFTVLGLPVIRQMAVVFDMCTREACREHGVRCGVQHVSRAYGKVWLRGSVAELQQVL